MYSKFLNSSMISLLFLFVYFFQATSVAVSSGGYEVPPDPQTIESIGKSTLTELPRRFKLFNWNIEKAKQAEVWAADFSKLQKDYDLVLIQEAISEDIFRNELKSIPKTIWNYFIAWIRKTERTSSGLVIGSRVKPTSTFFKRTKDTEFGIKTPKITGYQTFKIRGLKNQELLVINIHAINFVSTEKFARHIAQVMEQVDRHTGPIVFVGDMNTWNKKRLALLKDESNKRNLVWYDFERPDIQGMHSKLDHIFIRGLKVHEIKSLTQISSSDHYPISAELEVPL